jgi:hypothetical protein
MAAKPLSVPAERQRGRFSTAATARQQGHPEGPVQWDEARPSSAMGVDRKLLPQGQFDDRLLTTRSKEGGRAASDKHDE